MTDATMAPETDPDGEWFGHPKGLFYLFFAEMWERFCFYGMRNILVLYMVHHFAYAKDYVQAGVYAAYTSLIYCVAIGGGYVADKFLGYRTSIILGGVQMAAGMTLLLFNRNLFGLFGLEVTQGTEEFFFFAGMATIIVGNGFFKPNISTIVGKLYAPGDPRRDGGFTIFYMGINVGALFGGIICAELGQRVSWTLGFGVAAAGMLLGVFTFSTAKCRVALKGHGEAKDEGLKKRSYPIVVVGSLLIIPVFYFLLQNSKVVGWVLAGCGIAMLAYLLKVAFEETKEQREKIYAILVLVIFNVVFWALFEQAGSSLTLYADSHLDKSVFGMFEIASGTIQNFNAFFIIALAPVFAWLWVKLASRGKDPSIPAKFALGLFQLALGFVLLVIGANMFSPDGMTPMIFMIGLYLMLTTGELCLSPVGLSMITKLAPQRMTGMMMGAWFLSIAGANFVAGQIAALTGAKGHGGDEAPKEFADDAARVASMDSYADIYLMSFYVVCGVAVLLTLMIPLLKKWMHGVK